MSRVSASYAANTDWFHPRFSPRAANDACPLVHSLEFCVLLSFERILRVPALGRGNVLVGRVRHRAFLESALLLPSSKLVED